MGSLLLFGVACGGKVVVESTGTTGAGGAGGGGGAGGTDFVASTSVVGPSSVASSSTGGVSLCQQFCANEASTGCNSSTECLASCENAIAMAGACASQLNAVLQCFIGSGTTTCTSADLCQGPAQAYQACVSPQTCTGPTSCSGTSDGTCDCFAECNGSKLEVQCTPGNATDFCTCFKDGMPIDKCGEPQGTGLACSIEQGCCAKSFFP
jgi:hypothetical protein